MNQDPLADYGEFAHLVSVRMKLERLKECRLGDGAVLLLPGTMLAGMKSAYGLTIVRADVDQPMLGLPGMEGV